MAFRVAGMGERFRCVSVSVFYNAYLSLSFREVSVRNGVAWADVVACHAECAVFAPFGCAAFRKADVLQGTYAFAASARFANIAVYAEIVRRSEKSLKEFSYDVCLQPRECAVVNIVRGGRALAAHRLGNVRFDTVLRRCLFLFFDLGRIDVKSWQAYIRVAHRYGKCGIQRPAAFFQRFGKFAVSASRVVATGKHRIHVWLFTFFRKGQPRDEIPYHRRHVPSVNGEYKPNSFAFCAELKRFWVRSPIIM